MPTAKGTPRTKKHKIQILAVCSPSGDLCLRVYQLNSKATSDLIRSIDFPMWHENKFQLNNVCHLKFQTWWQTSVESILKEKILFTRIRKLNDRIFSETWICSRHRITQIKRFLTCCRTTELIRIWLVIRFSNCPQHSFLKKQKKRNPSWVTLTPLILRQVGLKMSPWVWVACFHNTILTVGTWTPDPTKLKNLFSSSNRKVDWFSCLIVFQMYSQLHLIPFLKYLRLQKRVPKLA